MSSAPVTLLVGWSLTYLLHSTLLLGGAWLVSRRLSGRRPALQEAIWRGALVGGLLTASLQLAAGIEPLTGRLGLRVASAESAAAYSLGSGSLVDASAVHATHGRDPARLAVRLPPPLIGAGLACWGLLGLVALVRLSIGRRRFRRRLRRHAATDPELLGALEETCRAIRLKAAPRLTLSAALASPAAVGRCEVCLPERLAAEMSREELRAVLAHELGHLRRKDPAWTMAAAAMTALFPFQPLNRLARRELRELSELLCDDLARRTTGEPLVLARALLGVAARLGHVPTKGMAPSFALLASGVERRVRRLLEDSNAGTLEIDGRRLIAPGLMAALLAVWLTPGFVVQGQPLDMVPAGTPIGPGGVTAAAHVQINAVDPAGEFTVSMRGGRVIAATIEGVAVPQEQLVQTSDSLRFLGRDGRTLFSVRVRPDGGISWEARAPDWPSRYREST